MSEVEFEGQNADALITLRPKSHRDPIGRSRPEVWCLITEGKTRTGRTTEELEKYVEIIEVDRGAIEIVIVDVAARATEGGQKEVEVIEIDSGERLIVVGVTAVPATVEV